MVGGVSKEYVRTPNRILCQCLYFERLAKRPFLRPLLIEYSNANIENCCRRDHPDFFHNPLYSTEYVECILGQLALYRSELRTRCFPSSYQLPSL